jgi:hypothetical protein
MIIAVDFDGTIVEHQFPKIGPVLPDAIVWLKNFQLQGAQLILHTMRSSEHLVAAVDFCHDLGLSFWAINNNPDQQYWTASPKIYAHLYIDDAAFGCPLTRISGGRPSVDWSLVGPGVSKMICQEKYNGSR